MVDKANELRSMHAVFGENSWSLLLVTGRVECCQVCVDINRLRNGQCRIRVERAGLVSNECEINVELGLSACSLNVR